MATLLKTTFKPTLTTYPILYVDSINQTSYAQEMHSYCSKYIRENTDLDTVEIKSRLVDEKDIRLKEDGYWYTFDKEQTVTMYKKTTSLGYLYNSINIEKLFTLTVVKCSKTIPKIKKNENTVFDDFSKELFERVSKMKSE